MDILGPILDALGVPKYAIVVVDRFSKWPEIEICETADTDEILAFLTIVFLREGIPRMITSDNGPQFTSEKWNAFMKRSGIQTKHTPVYHPAGNGLAERFNRVIMGSIQAAISAGKNWEKVLKSTMWAYCITPTRTGYSPFKILRGRDPFTKDNIAWKKRTVQSKWSPDIVRRNLEDAQRTYMDHYNKRRTVKEKSLERGEWVRVRLAQLQRKGESRYSGPMQVREVYSRSALLSDGKVWSQERMARCNKVIDWGRPKEPQSEREEQRSQEVEERTRDNSIQDNSTQNLEMENCDPTSPRRSGEVEKSPGWMED